jgi:hypothetical protein
LKRNLNKYTGDFLIKLEVAAKSLNDAPTRRNKLIHPTLVGSPFSRIKANCFSLKKWMSMEQNASVKTLTVLVQVQRSEVPSASFMLKTD